MTDWKKVTEKDLEEARKAFKEAEEEFKHRAALLLEKITIHDCDHDFSDKGKVLDLTNNWIEYNICTKCGFECLPELEDK